MATPGQSTRKLTMDDIRAAAERLKNWGRWGADDEIGTLNYTRPEDIVAAARLVQKGKVMSLALAFDNRGPQGGKSNYPSLGRFNPIHLMLRTGTDAYSGVLDSRKIRGADDIVIMPMQCGTQWDGLGHIFYGDHMWNGYDCRTVTSAGAQKCGIEKTRDSMVGRGVLLDIPRMLGQDHLPDGFAVTCDLLDSAERHFGVGGRGAAISCWCAPARSRRSSRRQVGTAIPAATRRGSPSRRSTGCTRSSSRRSPPTPGASRSGPTRPTRRTSRGTGSRSRSWA